MYISFSLEKKVEALLVLLLEDEGLNFGFSLENGHLVPSSLLPSTGQVSVHHVSSPVSQLFSPWLVWICCISRKCSFCMIKMQENFKAFWKLLVKIINRIKWGKINWNWHLSHRFFIKLSKSNNASFPSLSYQEVHR